MSIEQNGHMRIPFFSQRECDSCIEYIKWKENDLKDKLAVSPGIAGKDIGIVTPEQVNTTYFDYYNFFKENPQYIDRLSDVLYQHFPNLPRPLLVQSWSNIYKKGEGIDWHTHAGTPYQSFTANIFIGGNTRPGLKMMKPGEENTTWHLENNIGEMIIFNVDQYHSVEKNTSDETRYTIGLTFHSYVAITPDLLLGAAINRSGSIIILA